MIRWSAQNNMKLSIGTFLEETPPYDVEYDLAFIGISFLSDHTLPVLFDAAHRMKNINFYQCQFESKFSDDSTVTKSVTNQIAFIDSHITNPLIN